MFIYSILMPSTSKKYDEIVDWMRSKSTDRSDRMMRIVTDAQEVSSLLEDTVLHSFLLKQ